MFYDCPKPRVTVGDHAKGLAAALAREKAERVEKRREYNDSEDMTLQLCEHHAAQNIRAHLLAAGNTIRQNVRRLLTKFELIYNPLTSKPYLLNDKACSWSFRQQTVPILKTAGSGRNVNLLRHGPKATPTWGYIPLSALNRPIMSIRRTFNAKNLSQRQFMPWLASQAVFQADSGARKPLLN